MRYCIFGKALYDRSPRRLAGPFKKLESVRRAVRVLRWEGYRELRIRPLALAANRPRTRSAYQSRQR